MVIRGVKNYANQTVYCKNQIITCLGTNLALLYRLSAHKGIFSKR